MSFLLAFCALRPTCAYLCCGLQHLTRLFAGTQSFQPAPINIFHFAVRCVSLLGQISSRTSLGAGLAFGLGEGLRLGVGVAAGVGLGVGIGVGVAVGVGDADGAGLGDGDGLGLGLGLGDTDGVGVGVGNEAAPPLCAAFSKSIFAPPSLKGDLKSAGSMIVLE